MNLHSIVSAVVSAVSPNLSVSLLSSTGYVTANDGTQIPAYIESIGLTTQIQALSNRDLKQLEGIPQGGEMLAAYINGPLNGVIRAGQKGGDLLALPDNSVWLVTQILENWNRMDGWTKAAITRQQDTDYSSLFIAQTVDFGNPTASGYVPAVA